MYFIASCLGLRKVARLKIIFDYLGLLSPVIGLALNALIQVSCFRLIPSLGLLRSVYLGFASGLLSVAFFGLYIFLASIELSAASGSLVTNLIIYSSLGYCYFHFINLGETARRIRILRELYDLKEGLSLEEILIRYNAKEIIERRLARLINNGQILFKEGRLYINKPTMLFIAKIMSAAKVILLGKKANLIER